MINNIQLQVTFSEIEEMSFLNACHMNLTWNFVCSCFCKYCLCSHSLGLCCRCNEQQRIHLDCLLGYETI